MNKKDTVAVIRSLLSTTKNPYTINILNREFKNETGSDIPLYGYDCISDFLRSVPDAVELTGIFPNEQIHLVINEKSSHVVALVERQKKDPRNCQRKKKLLLPRKNIDICTKNSFQLKQGNDKLLLFSLETDIFFKSVFPTEVLANGEKISFINLEHHTRVGEYIEVQLAEICNPHKFHLHFRKFKKKLLQLQSKLQFFYFTHKNYEMPDAALKPKQICAALLESNSQPPKWHRAEIIKRFNDTLVIVDLIDFGKIIKTPKQHLKFLHRDFGALPRQAIWSSLANIIPSNKEFGWSITAEERFLDLVFGKDLIAGVINVNSKVPWMEVTLTFTKGTDTHINDILVEEGFATFQMKTSKTGFVCEEWQSNLNEIKQDDVEDVSFNNNKLDCNYCKTNIIPSESSFSRQAPSNFLYLKKNDKLKKMFSIV